ncbi:MAG: hypothetical protein HY590_01160 [Candidatus Omnitrophica bacterium]|nr:hypothetical protein [Candidatus Omnitrophota bacterium]
MKSVLFTFLILYTASWVFAAEESDNVRDAILGTNPRVEATMATSPLNQFLKDVFRPNQPIENRSALQAPYEEVTPVESTYYQNRARYYDRATYHETPSAEQKGYYEEGGRYYLPPRKPRKK